MRRVGKFDLEEARRCVLIVPERFAAPPLNRLARRHPIRAEPRTYLQF